MKNERFSALLAAPVQDSQHQNRLRLAFVIASVASVLAGATVVVGERVRVVAVAPPSINYVMVSLNTQPMLPAAAAPPQAPCIPEPPKDESPNELEFVEPSPNLRPQPTPRPALPRTVIGTIPGFPGFHTGIGGSSATRVGTPTGQQKGQQVNGVDPLRAVMARAIYQPLPLSAALQQTPTGRTSRIAGSVTVSFCVEATGRVGSVTVVRGFPNDSAVDAIVRDTVRTWRFSPMVVGDRARKMCADKVFNVRWK